ncbi:MAG: hypothetical protein NW226_14485 [Microscillaceae bacterium]|nr:hypothetical protein [Microscillaceae bacterium]
MMKASRIQRQTPRNHSTKTQPKKVDQNLLLDENTLTEPVSQIEEPQTSTQEPIFSDMVSPQNDSAFVGENLLSMLQQRSAKAKASSFPNAIQKKAKAIRFQSDATLEAISEGKRTLKDGDKDLAVIKMDIALAELGYYTIDAYNENFTTYEYLVLLEYQKAKGINQSGALDQPTFEALDKDFSTNYQVERNKIASITAADINKGTHIPHKVESDAIKETISTEIKVDPVTKKKPDFIPEILGKGKYEDRVRKVVEDTIINQYERLGKNKAKEHKDPKNLHDWGQIEKIALESKKAVDRLFGDKYYSSRAKAPMVKNVNLFDAWSNKEKQFAAGGKAFEDESINWRVQKIIEDNENEVATISREHQADQSRSPEKELLAAIQKDMVKKYRSELVATHKGWPGFADEGKVFIQLFKGKTDEENKNIFWKLFKTCIHEYIHTLEHPDHVKYRNTMSDKQGNKVLREGITDYLTKIVWNSVSIDDALRATIEGSYHDPKNAFKVPGLGTYGEASNAEQLAGIVGLKNLLAAFFLGKVNLIQ